MKSMGKEVFLLSEENYKLFQVNVTALFSVWSLQKYEALLLGKGYRGTVSSVYEGFFHQSVAHQRG